MYHYRSRHDIVPEHLPERQYLVSPVQRAFRLLRHISEGDTVSVLSRTAKEIGINRTTLMRLLATLEREAIIERRREGIGYALGPGVRRLCAGALFGSDIVKIADPILIALTAQLGLSSHLAELDGRSALYLLRRVPNAHLVSSIQIGTRVDAHTVNAGRIILAHWPEDQVRALYKGVKLKRVTDQLPTRSRSCSTCSGASAGWAFRGATQALRLAFPPSRPRCSAQMAGSWRPSTSRGTLRLSIRMRDAAT